MGDPGKGPGGPTPPPSFLDQREAHRPKNTFWDRPPLISGSEWPRPPPPPPSLSEGLDLPLRKAYEVTAARTSGRVNFSFSRQTGFSHPFFFIKPMVVTEPTVPSTRPLSLGLKLYPSNMQRMRNEDLTRFMHSLSWVRQNGASERKALIAGCTHFSLTTDCSLD